MKEIEIDDIVLCTVEKIVGTTVFVKIEDNKKDGTIVFSEIAPGRIRNIRDYVVPNKKIVCKVLRIDSSGTSNLSLRRVTQEERKILMDKYEKEKIAKSIIRVAAKEDFEKIISKLENENKNLNSFLQEGKLDNSLFDEYFTKEQKQNITKILNEKKEKLKEIKKDFSLSSKKANGIEIIKNTLFDYKDKIMYLGAGKYRISLLGKEYKTADRELQKILEVIKDKAKKYGAEFKVEEK